MLNAMQKHFPSGVEWWAPLGGLYYWVRVPLSLKTVVKSLLFQKAFAMYVLYVPGELCFANDPTRRKPGNTMRISFGGGTEQNIQLGIERLGNVLSEML